MYQLCRSIRPPVSGLCTISSAPHTQSPRKTGALLNQRSKPCAITALRSSRQPVVWQPLGGRRGLAHRSSREPRQKRHEACEGVPLLTGHLNLQMFRRLNPHLNPSSAITSIASSTIESSAISATASTASNAIASIAISAIAIKDKPMHDQLFGTPMDLLSECRSDPLQPMQLSTCRPFSSTVSLSLSFVKLIKLSVLVL